MAYTYPDKEDKLTCKMIDTEYDNVYWAASEAQGIRMVKSQIGDLLANNRTSDTCAKVRLLDIGCGMGRLFFAFSDVADEIIAIEPDKERFESAVLEGKRVSMALNVPVKVKNGDYRVLPEDECYEIILSSHVLQHIKTDMTEELFAEMSRRLSPGGVILLMTTYSQNEDSYFLEKWDDGRRITEKIDKNIFNETFGVDGVLPVRNFSVETIKKLAKKNGLKCKKMYGYHYKNHTSSHDDVISNEAGILEGAKDIMYVLEKDKYENEITEKDITIDGNVCYHFSFSIFDDSVGLRTDDEGELRSAIKEAYPSAIFDDDEGAKEEPLFRDLDIGCGFLHGGKLPFNCFRVLLKDYNLKFKNYEIANSSVFATIFPESDTIQICVALSVKNALIDDFVYLRHVQGNGAKLQNIDGRMVSVREIFEEVSSGFKRKITDVEEVYLLEVRRWQNSSDINEIISTQTRQIYGLMTGDEGWRHVPQELAETRMQNSWGSREFIRFIAFGNNSVFFNLSDSEAACGYRQNRKNFDAKFYGDVNPYFTMDSDIAGVNHGILFSIELVMVIKTICDRILRRQANYYIGGQGNKMNIEIRKIKAYRGELITTLSKVESLEISEIGELERVMLSSQQIEPIIDRIKYLLELLESELDLLYQTSTNKLVNLLTVAGLILAAIQVLQGII